MFKKNTVAAGLAAFASVALAAGCAVADGNKSEDVDITAMSAEELAEYMIFEAGGMDLDQAVQEGGTVRDRQVQDDIQALCSIKGDPDGDTAGQVVAAARASYERPEGGVQLGDWRKGAELARSGFGFRVGHRVDDHSNREPGGNCYACHQMDPQEDVYGTIGPSLVGYGKTRGTSEAMLNYVHEVVSNPHQYFPCTEMPRFGANGFLTQDQISHLMAYLMDPESPVNQ